MLLGLYCILWGIASIEYENRYGLFLECHTMLQVNAWFLVLFL